MAKIRDRVWNAAMQATKGSDRPVRSDRLAEALDCSERTVRDVLHFMDSTGWIKRVESDGGRVFYEAGEKLTCSQENWDPEW